LIPPLGLPNLSLRAAQAALFLCAAENATRTNYWRDCTPSVQKLAVPKHFSLLNQRVSSGVFIAFYPVGGDAMQAREILHSRPVCDIPCFIGATKMIADERILEALQRSTLVAELRDVEIQVLMGLLTIKRYASGEFITKPDTPSLGDALLILVEGKIEVRAVVNGEPVSLLLKEAGDLARIISFVGSNLLKIDADIAVKQDCTVLLLERAKLETLLDTPYHRVVYYVMRSLVRHTHSLARHKSAETEEINNYFYRLNALY
jgi:hypothetical protein